MRLIRRTIVLVCGFAQIGFAAPEPVVICQYNVENYLDATPARPGQSYGTRAKPEKQIEALVRIVTEIRPDILGVCEMGSVERFADFKRRLSAAGLEYSDSEYVAGPDEERHLALLSRYPIVARQSLVDIPFELNGQPQKVRRGFLDVTIELNSTYRLRMVGVHFKSKLPVPEGEALIRRHEAQKLREHIEKIVAAEPNVNLVAYGDFNDSKNEPMFQEVSGVRGTPTYMADLWAKDPLGDRWTHYWRTADIYSRFDYIFVSPALFREVVKTKSTVYRSADWNEASDHRPVYATIIPINK
jgi:endonuclease/exonuclease/phosphatase family metal-dependent hydrolase